MSWNKEIILYTIFWTVSVLYSAYCFATESQYLFKYLEDHYGDFKSGWNILNRRKDVADFEWVSFLYLFNRIYLWISIQLVLVEGCCFLKISQISRYISTTLAVFFISNELGIIPLIIILLQPCLFTWVMLLKNPLVVWLTNGICLLLFSLYKEVSKNEEFLAVLNVNEKQAYIIITAVCWTNLRCVSYSLDHMAKHSKNIFNVGRFMDFLEYSLYLPALFFGPYISYQDFRAKYESRVEVNWKTKYKCLMQDITRCLFWLVFMEAALHFIYVNATSFQPQMVMSLGAWALYGYGYTMGQAFHIKYMVMYGLSTKVAKFEGITVPTLPKCIGRIHLYSDMWKYFDPGLHTFLVRYIYIPTMRSKRISNRILSTLFCFAFVYVWHGLEGYIFIWAFLNFVGMSIEILSETLFEKYVKNTPIFCGINQVWLRRLKCLAASPLLMMSAASNFYFFAGTNIGDIFVMRTLNGDCHVIIVLLLALYSCCQVSTELRTPGPEKNK